MMHRAKKLKVIELNQHIICKLCKGYFIDATTIIECLHSFCRSCIVKYLETNKYCPVCDVQVHKTKPLLNIRSDRILQDIVYKLVPRLYQNEVQRRREFTTLHPETRENFQQFLDKNQSLLTIDESISITLYYYGCKDRTQRYLRCPAAVTIGHLQKLIRAKYNLTDDNHYVDILYENIEQQDKEKQQQQQKEHCLNSTLTLLDIAYIYKWNRKTPMELCYRIYEYSINCKKQKLDDDKQIISNNNNNDNNKSSDNSDCGNNGNNNNNNNNNNNINSNNWKEVQLRISENGEMSITGIQDENLELLNNNNNNNNNKSSINNNNNNNNKKIVTFVETKTSNSNNNNNVNRKELPDLRSITKNDISNSPLSATTATTTTVYSTINSTKCSISEDNHHHHHHHNQTILKQPQQRNVKKSSTTTIVNESKSCKRKLDSIANELPTKRPKQTILNHQIGVYNLSNNHPLKRHSLVVDKTGDCENLITTTTGMITTTTTPTKIQSKPCYMPKTTVNTPKSSSNNNNNGRIDTKSSMNNSCTTILTTTTTTITTPNHSSNNNSNIIGTNNNNKLNIKSKASTPIGYKTLRDPPKSWNSQISKANLLNKPILDNTKYNNNNNNTTNNNNNNNCNNNNNGNDLKNMRPAKFFKMRNNLPRYLGNPASGVKPMYQLHNTSPEKETTTTINNNNTSGTTMITTTTATNTLSCSGGGGEIKKHSIVKIDPKTLRPITEKASETTSLVLTTTTTSTTTTTTTTTASATIMSDLKINTSSVSIFNPLKLQNSPKSSNNNSNNNSDRKSPKSPHSPKLITSGTTTITATTTSTTVNKRDNKLNLNFTPSNPFIPNLTSPTINPNQFLYPTTGPPHGFPPYDPRFMAAYHSLLYRQRMAFPTSLSLDISNNGGGNNNNNEQQQQQKKINFDSAPSSPKLTLNQQPIVSQDNQISPTTTANNTSLTTKITTTNEQNSLITTAVTTVVTTSTTTRLPSLSSSKTQTNQSLKRGKESTNKSEKSLQSTVEKLKNNRVKEAAGNCAQTTNTSTTTTNNISNSKEESERIETKTVDINEKIANKDDGEKNQEIEKLSDKHLDSEKSNDKKDTNGDKCEQEQQQQQEEKQQKCHEDKDNSK